MQFTLTNVQENPSCGYTFHIEGSKDSNFEDFFMSLHEKGIDLGICSDVMETFECANCVSVIIADNKMYARREY